MKTLILHIGTAKTGTTTLQRFLHVNRTALARQGIGYPISPGRTNHRALAMYAMADNRIDGAIRAAGLQAPATRAQWRTEFRDAFGAELRQLASDADRVLLSSEHCQSRLTNTAAVQCLHDLLHPFFGRIEIVVYLRRQDELAVSRYNTRIKTGQTGTDFFYPRDAASHYYDYRRLLDLWSSIFGREAVRPRLFDRRRLIGGSILHDFAVVAGLDLHQLKMSEDHNRSLSAPALEILRIFNAQVPSNAPEAAVKHLRQRYIHFFESRPSGPQRLPARAAAMAFQQQFATINAAVAHEWFAGRPLFDEDFSRYPDTEATVRLDHAALARIFAPAFARLVETQPGLASNPDDNSDLEQLADLLAE